MTFWAPRFSQRKWKSSNRPVASFRPQLEVLEDRVVPALINHGGPILASVQVQALYLGAGWTSQMTGQFDGFLNTTVSGTKANPAPYLAMLNKTGFTGVTGAGSAVPGVLDYVSVPSDLTDAQIQADLTTALKGTLQAPSSNTLYFVFVQPGTVVDFGNGQTSQNTFLAYHSWFTYSGAGSTYEVPYAVVPYHGSAGNAQDAWLNQFDSMTVAASHELAESITDPTGNSWYDRTGNENGDIVNGSTVYLPGQGGTQYAVQREVAIPGSQYNYLATTPTGATAGHSDTFTLSNVTNGTLYMNGKPIATPGGFAVAYASVNAQGSIVQGIDDFGQPMIDVVLTNGNAYEFHDFAPINGTTNPVVTANPSFFPWTSLGGNVSQAAAGQGVSYVLLTNHNLSEYVDPNYNTYYYGYGVNPGSRNGVIAGNVTAIVAAGLDQQNVNAVEYVSGGKTTLVWRDVTGRASSSTVGFNPSAKKVSSHSDANGAALNAARQAEAFVVADTVAGPTFRATNTLVVGPAPIPGATPGTPQSFLTHFNLPDGGGGGVMDVIATGHDRVDDTGVVPAPTDSPANLADVPVFGPAFVEAVRQLKDARQLIPSHVWPAVPAKQVAPPAPPTGRQGTPETKAPEGARPFGLMRNGVLAAIGFGFVGLTRPTRRRRQPRLEAGLPQKP